MSKKIDLEEDDYIKYRGKCKEYAERAAAADPSLRVVRGHYYCAAWGEQAHWWCVKEDGTIVDPTAMQFPSKGTGVYVEFDGIYQCEQCGKDVREEEVIIYGNYPFCCGDCVAACVL